MSVDNKRVFRKNGRLGRDVVWGGRCMEQYPASPREGENWGYSVTYRENAALAVLK